MEQETKRTDAPMPDQGAPGDPATMDATGSEAQPVEAAPLPGAIPVEPALELPDAADPVIAAKQRSEILKSLLAFYAHGLAPVGETAIGETCWPALLHPYREFAAIRHEFPLCLLPPGADRPARSLAEIVDEFVDESGPDGDEKERLRRHACQLEARIGELVSENPGLSLDAAVRKASENLLDVTPLAGKKKQRLGEDLEQLRAALARPLGLAGCEPDLPCKLFEQVAPRHWGTRSAAWSEQLATLIHNLRDILRVDFDHSPDAKSAGHLRDALGTGQRDDVDAERMAAMLSRTRLAEPLPEDRRTRIRETLETLTRLQPLFGDPDRRDDSNEVSSFSLDSVSDDCAAALAHHDARQREMVAFFRAVRVAELEVSNRYEAALHDSFFASFDASHLSREELSLCPPVVLVLHQAHVGDWDVQALLGLLVADLPVKIILQLDCLGSRTQADRSTWVCALPRMAMSLGHVFVMQCPASRPGELVQGFARGLDHIGSALFCVYTGAPTGESRLPRYLDCASATESRAFPAYEYDPDRGPTQAERMCLLDNPQQTRAWVSEPFAFRDASGANKTRDIAFTLADFLMTDVRQAEFFCQVPPSHWHPNMVPLDEFLDMDWEIAVRDVPYLLAVDENEKLHRVVVARSMVRQIARCAARWRTLQEEGGIGNSHALNLLAAEKDCLQQELAEEVARIREQHELQLEQGVGELTREIVARIAAQLTDGADSGFAAASTPSLTQAAAAPPAAESAAVAEAVAAESSPGDTGETDDEDSPSLDEPYIDTPLCTACDDCTTMSAQIFAYNEDKQAYIKDAAAGTYQELVLAAEKCPVSIIHPGKPRNADEPNLDEWITRAKPYL